MQFLLLFLFVFYLPGDPLPLAHKVKSRGQMAFLFHPPTPGGVGKAGVALLSSTCKLPVVAALYLSAFV